jgi:hypothetical protein
MKTAKITIGGVYVGDYITSFNLSPKQAAEQFKDLAYFHKKRYLKGWQKLLYQMMASLFVAPTKLPGLKKTQ